MHATFIDRWSFGLVFKTLLRLFSLRKFNKWIFSNVLALFHIAPQITRVLGVACLLAMIKCLGHYEKNGCFAISLVIQVLSYRRHLQLIIFIHCEC
jgi:hypothetical protein